MKLWPILACAFGLGTLALFVAFNLLPAVSRVYAFGELSEAVSAFQRSASMADLEAVITPARRDDIIAAMSAANTLDLYAFIPTYTLFVTAAALMLGGRARNVWTWLALAPTLIAAIADLIETSAQLRVTADWANAAAHLPPIAPAHWVKFTGLALGSLGFTALALRAQPKHWVVAALGVTPIIGLALALTNPALSDKVISVPLALLWMALLVVAARAVVRPRAKI